MTHKKLTLLGFSALTLVAISGLVTSGAQATGEHVANFTCLKNGVNVHCTGDGEEAQRHNSEQTKHTVTFGFTTESCSSLESDITTDVDGTSTTASTWPMPINCTGTGGRVIDVSVNECEYEYHVEADKVDVTAGESEYEGSTSIACASGYSITRTVTESGSAKCIVHIPGQTTIKPIYFRNMTGPPTSITVEAVSAAATATFTPVGPGSLFTDCGVFSEHGTIKFTGSTTFRATNTLGEIIDFRID